MPTSRDRLRVYLCDLTHDSILLVSDTIPVNIGFIGAYARKVHANAIDVSLFKYPRTAIEAIRAAPPDVIALSNYSWNSRLSEHLAGIAKRIHPATLTVQGGPNFPERGDLQLEFLKSRPNTDVFVELEGEVAFAELIAEVLAARDSGRPLSERPIPGCVRIAPSTRGSPEPTLLKGERPERLRDLDEIPSPYLDGSLDDFFDGRLAPFIETNRGCPFECTFCHTGNRYFNKINTFSIDRIRSEIHRIGPHMKATGIRHLYLADTNFGMYARDKEICDELRRAQDLYGWPLHMYATTGKNNKERVIEITRSLGQSLTVHMSVQSMDSTVLANIKRSNIRLEDYRAINRTLAARGQFTRGEVIIGLPGETRESFTRGMSQLLNGDVSVLTSYTLILLHGTEFKDPDYQKRFGIVGKYRLVPLNFGEYDGERIFDVEEAGIENDHMSFDDYLWLRGLSLMVEVLHNSRPFLEFFRYVRAFGVAPFDLILRLYESKDGAPAGVREVFEGFMRETRDELWDSEEALVAHYRRAENFQHLLTGEAGGNVINKYKAAALVVALEDWIDFVGATCRDLALERSDGRDATEIEREVATLRAFTLQKLDGLLDARADTSPREMLSGYDVLGWLAAKGGEPLSEHLRDAPIRYCFEYSIDQIAVREDMFRRYGTGLNGISKIVTRVSSIESLIRHVRPADGWPASTDDRGRLEASVNTSAYSYK